MFTFKSCKTLIARFHTSPLNLVDKAQLSKLRKKTGFPFIKCRNALEKFDNDINQASNWLKEQAQKEGWAKATKLADRPMSNGLVSIFHQKSSACILEVNCETDFVSRNLKFQNLVVSLTKEIGKEPFADDDDNNKKRREWKPVDFSKAVNDLIAMEIGNIGENIKFRRAAHLTTPPPCDLHHDLLFHYVHPSGAGPISIDDCDLGKFGSIVSLRKPREVSGGGEEGGDGNVSLDLIGRQLCQHIVGMKPTSVDAERKEDQPKDENESRLLHQEFLMDEKIKVSEFLAQQGVKVNDFVRYELGEINDE